MDPYARSSSFHATNETYHRPCTVLPELAQFIYAVLGPLDHIRGLEVRSLSALYVNDLKKLVKHMDRVEYFSQKRGRDRSFNSLKKHELIRVVQSLIYLDAPHCTMPDPAASLALLTATKNISVTTMPPSIQKQPPELHSHTTNATTTHPSLHSTRPPFPLSQPNHQQQPHPYKPQARLVSQTSTEATGGAHRVTTNAVTANPTVNNTLSPPQLSALARSSMMAARPANKRPHSASTATPANFPAIPATRTSVSAGAADALQRYQMRHGGARISGLASNAAQSTPVPTTVTTSRPIPSISAPIPPPAIVKREPDLDDEDMNEGIGSNSNSDATSNSDEQLDVVRNETEMRLMTELLQMGFTDRVEILCSIRRLSGQDDSHSLALPNADELTSDTIMLDIISQREEVEEARKMDQARKLSEQTRKQEAQRRRSLIEEEKKAALRQASWSEWLERSDMYAQSWILRHEATRVVLEPRVVANMRIKCRLLELLDLEKKAFKWYGPDLPRTYFCTHLIERLVDGGEILPDSMLLVVMEEEVKKLEQQMFTLSEQQGGVPRLFLDFHEAAGTSARTPNGHRRREQNVENDADDDVEVMFVKVNQMSSSKDSATPVGGSRKKMKLCSSPVVVAPVGAASPEVIEIL